MGSGMFSTREKGLIGFVLRLSTPRGSDQEVQVAPFLRVTDTACRILGAQLGSGGALCFQDRGDQARLRRLYSWSTEVHGREV